MENKEKNINGMMIAGVIVNAVILLINSANPELGGVFLAILSPFIILSVIGLAVSSSSDKKTGPIMVIIGSALFVPIGLIAIMGAKKVLDRIRLDELNLNNESESA